MLIQRFYDDKLAQASYLVGCQATGEALVLDANRDLDQYIRVAEREGLRITHVTETHIHADFLSGSRDLAGRTGAKLLLSDEGDAHWKYAFAAAARAVPLHDGDRFIVGNLRLEVLHTPGHTPEHLSFVVTDTPASDSPMLVFTGDFVFVGDVGRPDLLERAAKHAGTMEGAARTLYRSLQRFKSLPEYLQIWPGHGAGSACGKALGAVPSSTLGYEKLTNWGLAEVSEDVFVEQVLAGQPEPPRYFAEMKRLNRDGPPPLAERLRPERISGAQLGALLRAGASVVDTRPAAAFARGHVPGTINIPLNRSFTTWAGSLLPYDRELHLVVDGAHQADEATRDLAIIGLDRVAGIADGGSLEEWAAERGALEEVPQISADELAHEITRGGITVVDVRGSAEWQSARLPGSVNIPLVHLPEHVAELSMDRPIVVQCQTGSRSAIAASLLRTRGFANIMNLVGGLDAWQRADQRVEPEDDASGAARRIA